MVCLRYYEIMVHFGPSSLSHRVCEGWNYHSGILKENLWEFIYNQKILVTFFSFELKSFGFQFFTKNLKFSVEENEVSSNLYREN